VSTIVNEKPLLAKAWQTRQHEETEITDYFADSAVRLVGLVGAGGYGKSALAAHLYDQTQNFEVKLWINFQQPVEFRTFAVWLLRKLMGDERYVAARELYERQELEDLAQEALNRLAERLCLLVMDNLETLQLSQDVGLWQPYERFLQDWLADSSMGTVVLTTQVRWMLPTAAWRWVPLAGLGIEQGVALLKAQKIEGTEEDLRAFVAAADGHPLLLQLAASWLLRQQLENADPASIVRLQRDDVMLLRSIKELHRGDTEACVGDVLDRAFRMLHPQGLRVLLWRLSVLRVEFGVELAQAMGDEPVTLAELRKLARWSFVQEQRRQEEWEFGSLPLIQRYLQQEAREADELQPAHERAVAFFDSHRQPWTGNLEDCRSQFESFYHYCELGRYGDAKRVVDSCVDVLSRQGYYRSLVPMYEQLTQAWQPGDEVEAHNLGGAWTQLGGAYQALGRYRDAIAAHQQAQQQFQSISYRDGEAASLGNLGIAYNSLGQYQRAIEFYQQSLEIKREIGDRLGESALLGNLGTAYQSFGQYQRAIEFYQQSLEIKREISDRLGEAISLGNLGAAYQALGQYSQAIEFYQQSLKIKREISDRLGEANSLGNLGTAYQALGQYQRAIEFYEQSLETQREISDRLGEANSLGNLGNAYQALGQYQRAIEFYQQSLEIQREIGDRNGEANSLFNMASALAKLKRRSEALQNYQQAQQIYESLSLDFRVEQCQSAIAQLQKRPLRYLRNSTRFPWWGWFLVGVAIVLAIAWWLKK